MTHEESLDLATPETDPLTGLESRSRLPSIARASAMAFIDLNDFLGVNQRHGYEVGDRVLRTLAVRLQRDVHPWRMFRVGGDEFVVAVEGPIDRQGAVDLALRLGAQIALPITGIDDPITAHIGVSRRPVLDDAFEGYLVAQDLAHVARLDSRPFFVADADWHRGRPVYCDVPIATDPATLVSRLVDLTDRQRLEFANWSVGLGDCRWAAEVERGQRYLGQAETERAAVLAFDGLRHDGTVPDATGSSFFDPALGWGLAAWAQASSIVREMAWASFDRDPEPMPCVARALMWIADPPVYSGEDDGSGTSLTLVGLRRRSSPSA